MFFPLTWTNADVPFIPFMEPHSPSRNTLTLVKVHTFPFVSTKSIHSLHNV